MTNEQVEELEKLLKQASRASVLLKTPQCKELFKMMMDDMSKYNNLITGNKPLSQEDYLLNLGRLQGLRIFVNRLNGLADNKEKYAEQLKKCR